jgi:hypothetical protein
MTHQIGDDVRAAAFVLLVLFCSKKFLRWVQGGKYAHYSDDI